MCFTMGHASSKDAKMDISSKTVLKVATSVSLDVKAAIPLITASLALLDSHKMLPAVTAI